MFRLLSHALLYGAAFLFAEYWHGVLSCVCLLLLALWEYFARARETGSIVDLLGLFSLSWLGGQGLSVLRLSTLQEGWEPKTWLCFFLIYVFVHAGYRLSARRLGKKQERKGEEAPSLKVQRRRILYGIAAIALLSVAAFSAEAVILGFVPLFSEKGHAYLSFHVSGLHYFTVQSVMIPALTVLYFKAGRGSRSEALVLLGANAAAFVVPLLCVSRFQMVFAVALAAIVYVAVFEKGSVRTVLLSVGCLLPLYVLLSVFRNQDAAYLQSVFCMRNADIPVWIAQPYMYITSNYDNFNCMVANMAGHAFDGGRMLYPFFALTGLKLLFPVQISRPPFLVKEELSTFTLFYDSYYDFGIVGMCLFAFVLGVLAAVLTHKMKERENLIVYLFYGQLSIYLLLSFFTTWFSDPAVWFRLIFTGLLYKAVGAKTDKSRTDFMEKTKV